jgi:hypothetical protein
VLNNRSANEGDSNYTSFDAFFMEYFAMVVNDDAVFALLNALEVRILALELQMVGASVVLTDPIIIPAAQSLVVPSGSELVIDTDTFLTVDGDVIIDGKLTIGGTLRVNGTVNVAPGAQVVVSGGKIENKGITYANGNGAQSLVWFDMQIFTSRQDILDFLGGFDSIQGGGGNPENNSDVAATSAEKPNLVGYFRVTGADGSKTEGHGTIGRIEIPISSGWFSTWNDSQTSANKWWLLFNGYMENDFAKNTVWDDGNYSLVFQSISAEGTITVTCNFTTTGGAVSSYTLVGSNS